MEETNKKRRTKIDYEQLNKNKRFCNSEIIEEVVEEKGLSKELVERVVNSQSLHTKRIIRAGGLESIIYVYIGKFKVNPYKIQSMMANSMKI